MPAVDQKSGLIKGLGLTGATTLVMGSMIGSGIFIVSADVARQVKSPGLLIVCWILGALLTLIAALSYGELAAAMPHAGGQYVYLREAFGRLWGFLYGWTLFAVIQTGTIAAVAVAFAKYTGVFFPSVSAANYLIGSGKIGVTTQQLLAIAVIAPSPRKYARHPHGRDRAEYFHVRESSGAAGARHPGLPAGTQSAGHRGEFRPLLAGRRMELGCRFAGGNRHGRSALFLGRMEQCDLHGGRSAQSAPQSASVSRPRRRRRFRPLPRL